MYATMTLAVKMSNGLHSVLCQDIFLNALLSSEVHPLLANFLAAPVYLFRALNGLSELLESVSNFLST